VWLQACSSRWHTNWMQGCSPVLQAPDEVSPCTHVRCRPHSLVQWARWLLLYYVEAQAGGKELKQLQQRYICLGFLQGPEEQKSAMTRMFLKEVLASQQVLCMLMHTQLPHTTCC
jgi:hypothetical protein